MRLREIKNSAEQQLWGFLVLLREGEARDFAFSSLQAYYIAWSKLLVPSATREINS